MVLLSTHNIWFNWEITKLFFWYALLSKGLSHYVQSCTIPTYAHAVQGISTGIHIGGAVCLTRDRGAAGSSLTGVTALCPLARHTYPSLVLVQPRKTRLYITERLLIGTSRIKSNKNKMIIHSSLHIWCPTAGHRWHLPSCITAGAADGYPYRTAV